jgi:UDP-N-acetylmuramoylalanine--D-glutamate ligase
MLKSSPYSGKKVAVLGLGKSTVPLLKFLQVKNALITLSEIQPKESVGDLAREFGALAPPVESEFGKISPQWILEADTVVISSGTRPDPRLLEEARAKGVDVIAEVDFLAREVEVPLVAVMGTEGKTSVAWLLKTLLESARKTVVLAGDLGEPLAQFLARNGRADFVILELSAAQLEFSQRLRPHIVALTSLQAPYPERFPSADSYGAALRNVLKNLEAKNFIVYNFKDSQLKGLVAGNPAAKYVYRRKDPALLGEEINRLYKGAWLGPNSRELLWKEGEKKSSFSLRQLKLFGSHNRENLMSAVCLAKLLGVSDDQIQKTIDTISGIPHRLELVKKRGGVRFVNDSRSTTVDSLRVALESFPLDPLILIAGGRDAQADFTPLAEVVKARVKTLILVGEAKEHLNRCLGDHSETFLVGTFEEAVLLSYQKSREGDVILLSPGCESYDMFVSYEERGNYFKKYVDEV